MKTRMLIYRPDKVEPEAREVELEERPSLAELRAIVQPILDAEQPDGGPMERVAVLFEGKPADGFVGEFSAVEDLAARDAKRAGYRQAPLPVNPSATSVYWTFARSRGDNPNYQTTPAIHGAFVLFDRRVWF
jgi:hypothetical protein